MTRRIEFYCVAILAFYAWTTPALKIWKAQILPWMPISRPLGTAVCRVVYSIFGFHPLPLYVLSWLLLVGNVFMAWRFFRALAPSASVVHGNFQDLYLSTTDAVSAFVTEQDYRDGGAAFFRIHGHQARQWTRSTIRLYGALAIILGLFVLGRLRGIPGFLDHSSYRPHVDFGFWLKNVTEYMSLLFYRQVRFTAAAAAITLVLMMLIAVLLSNRAVLRSLPRAGSLLCGADRTGLAAPGRARRIDGTHGVGPCQSLAGTLAGPRFARMAAGRQGTASIPNHEAGSPDTLCGRLSVGQWL